MGTEATNSTYIKRHSLVRDLLPWVLLLGIAAVAIGTTIYFFLSDISPPDDTAFAFKLETEAARGNPFDEFRKWPGRRVVGKASFEAEFWQQLDTLLLTPCEIWRTDPVIINGMNGWEGYAADDCKDFFPGDIGRRGFKRVMQLVADGRQNEAVAFSLKLLQLGNGMSNLRSDAFMLSAGVKNLAQAYAALSYAIHAGGSLSEDARQKIGAADLAYENYEWAVRVEYFRFKSKLQMCMRLHKGFPIECDFEPWTLDSTIARIKPNMVLASVVNEWMPYLAPRGNWDIIRTKVQVSRSSRIIITESDWKRWMDRHSGRFATMEISNEFSAPMKWVGVECLLVNLWQRMSRCQIAIHDFEAIEGRLPQSLTELVPKLLPMVPRDPFADQPLQWNASERYLWSAGWDGIDDGGRIEPGEWLWPGHLERTASCDANSDLGMKYWWSKNIPHDKQPSQR